MSKHLFLDRDREILIVALLKLRRRIRNAFRIVRRAFARSNQWTIAIRRMPLCNYKICRVRYAAADRWLDTHYIQDTIYTTPNTLFFSTFAKFSFGECLIVNSERVFFYYFACDVTQDTRKGYFTHYSFLIYYKKIEINLLKTYQVQ